MEDLLFTVVIPAYNTAPYIEECLDSVVTSAMFCRDAEILVVDDGSTDGTGQILDEYAKKCNILRVIHQKNQGPSVARNTGIDAARGEYIYFVDSDDTITPEALPSLWGRITEYKKEHGGAGADLVANVRHKRISADGTVKHYVRNYDGWQEFPIEKVFLHFGYVAPWNFCIKTETIRERKLYFDTRLPVCNDFEWMPRMFIAMQSVVLNGTLCYCYRSHTNSLVSTDPVLRHLYVAKIFSYWWQEFHNGKYFDWQVVAEETYMRSQYRSKLLEAVAFENDPRYGELQKAFEDVAYVLEGSEDRRDIALLEMIKEHGIEYAQKEFPAYCKSLSAPRSKNPPAPRKKSLKHRIKRKLVAAPLWQKVLKPVRDKMRKRK